MAWESIVVGALSIGISAWKAADSKGWGVEELELLQEGIKILPKRRSDEVTATDRLCSAFHELVTVAFGEALRSHWHGDENLAPRRSSIGLFDRITQSAKKQREEQIQERVRMAAAPAVEGSGPQVPASDPLEEIYGSPLKARWYARLFVAFGDTALDSAGAEPLLHLSGSAKFEFEKEFWLAFELGLLAPRAAELAVARETRVGVCEYAMRALATELSTFGDAHIFEQTADQPGILPMPLRDIYVQPTLGKKGASASEPALVGLRAQLKSDETRVVVVTAGFGRGKSMTARMLACELAAEYITNPNEPSPDVVYPILVTCKDVLRKGGFNLEDLVRRSQKELASRFLPDASLQHPGFGLPAPALRCLCIFDGLDEVDLSHDQVREFISELLAHATRSHRFIIFSRIETLPSDFAQRKGVVHSEIEDFSTTGPSSQVAAWLDRWRRLQHQCVALASAPDVPTLEELEKRDLLKLCSVPVLLFMVAYSWQNLAGQQKIQHYDLYDEFVRTLARSKLQTDREGRHPVVNAAAQELCRVLIAPQSGEAYLPASATPEDAIIWLMAAVAWKDHCLTQQQTYEPLTTDHSRKILQELKLDKPDLEQIRVGLLLALGTNLEGSAQRIHFQHRSFREFLVAKHWLLRLPFMVEGTRDTWREALVGGLLYMPGDESFNFFQQGLPENKLHDAVAWAQDTFNDESIHCLSAPARLRDDRRSPLRHSALAIRCRISSTPPTIDDARLRSLLAFFWCRGEPTKLFLARANLAGANLAGADLDDANLNGANLAGADLKGARLAGANLTGANLKDANLTGAYLRGAHLQEACLENTHLFGAHLASVHLENVCLRNTHLDGADLEGVHLEGAKLEYAHVTGANLHAARLEGANLSDVTLTGANLEDAHLDSATLTHTSFLRADLCSAVLVNACFDDVNLIGARLDRANLENTHFACTNAKDASFYEARIHGADLRNVDGLTQDQVSKAIGDSRTQLPDGITRPVDWG